MRGRPNGFSMLETILALGLVVLVFFAVMEVIPGALFLVRGQERQQAAEDLARSLLEEQSARPWGELSVGAAEDLPELTRDGIRYRARLAVRAVAGQPPELARTLRLSVSWDYRGQAHEVTRELLVHHLRQN